MARAKRIVLYAINGAGLGHLSRLLGIAKWMRRIGALLDETPPEIFFLTSSDACDSLADSKFAAFKLPSKTVARSSGLDPLEYRRLAKHYIWQTLGIFTPDLLVVDTFPSGSFDELFQVLDGPFKKGFVYRHVKPEYARRPIFQSALSLYDSVVIPHSLNSDAARECLAQIPDGFASRCTGEVIQFDRGQLLDIPTARKELGIPTNGKLVYLSSGGGGDPSSEEILHELVSALQYDDSIHLLVGAGPLYRGKRLVGPRVQWCESPAIWKYFAACDAAVSAGGYNSFHELLYAKVPTLFYAQEKIADDQWKRVCVARDRGACLAMNSLSNKDAIRTDIERLLDPQFASSVRVACEELLGENGASRCAAELLRSLYPHGRVDWALESLGPNLVAELEKLTSGSSELVAQWCRALYPLSRLSGLMGSPVMDSLLNQLTPSASEEVKSVLANNQSSQNRAHLEKSAIELLQSIDPLSDPVSIRNLLEELIRTIDSISRKYEAFWRGGTKLWSESIAMILRGIKTLLEKTWPIEPIDVIKLLRNFPRIDDLASLCDLFFLFERFIESNLDRNFQTAELLRQVQILKISSTHTTYGALEKSLKANWPL